MSGIFLVSIACEDCGNPFSDGTKSTSLSEVRMQAVDKGWKVVPIYGKVFDFCPNCQRIEMAVKAAGAK